MKIKKISFNYKGRKIIVDAKVCNLFKMFKGLMFTRKEKAKILLFKSNRFWKGRINSYFVFFPFVAVWLDDKNNIIDLKLVKPFTTSINPKRQSKILIEIPINEKYNHVIKLLVGDKKGLKRELAYLI